MCDTTVFIINTAILRSGFMLCVSRFADVYRLGLFSTATETLGEIKVLCISFHVYLPK